MARASLTLVIVTCLALHVFAAGGSDKGTDSKPAVCSVGELLEAIAKGPIRAEHSDLLQAVACLVEREQPSLSAHGPVSQAPPPTCLEPDPQQRKRVVVRLRHAPAIDVAMALTEFLDSHQQLRAACTLTPSMVFVPEPTSNSLLISGGPSDVDDISRLIAQIDVRPDTVLVDVRIAEFEPLASQAEAADSAATEAPSMEKDGSRWLAWAEEHCRIKTLGRPQIMTLDNQPAFIQAGQRVPRGSSESGSNSPPELMSVGFTLGVTPHVSPEGQVLMELDVEHVSIVKRGSVPAVQKASFQTAVCARSGETTVLGGPIQRTEDGDRQLILALTPRVNPRK